MPGPERQKMQDFYWVFFYKPTITCEIVPDILKQFHSKVNHTEENYKAAGIAEDLNTFHSKSKSRIMSLYLYINENNQVAVDANGKLARGENRVMRVSCVSYSTLGKSRSKLLSRREKVDQNIPIESFFDDKSILSINLKQNFFWMVGDSNILFDRVPEVLQQFHFLVKHTDKNYKKAGIKKDVAHFSSKRLMFLDIFINENNEVGLDKKGKLDKTICLKLISYSSLLKLNQKKEVFFGEGENKRSLNLIVKKRFINKHLKKEDTIKIKRKLDNDLESQNGRKIIDEPNMPMHQMSTIDSKEENSGLPFNERVFASCDLESFFPSLTDNANSFFYNNNNSNNNWLNEILGNHDLEELGGEMKI